jgi:hypothetical protein
MPLWCRQVEEGERVEGADKVAMVEELVDDGRTGTAPRWCCKEVEVEKAAAAGMAVMVEQLVDVIVVTSLGVGVS